MRVSKIRPVQDSVSEVPLEWVESLLIDID